MNILNRHACMYEFKGIFTNKQQINRINYDKIETRLYIIGFDLPSRKNNSIDAASFCFFTRDLCWHHIVHQPHAPHDWTLSGPISIALRLQSHGMEDAAKWDEERLSEANINIYQHSIHSSTSFSIKLLDHRPNQPPTFAALQALLLMAYSRAADSNSQTAFPCTNHAISHSSSPAPGSSERQRNWTCWVVRIGLRESSQKSWESSWIISVLQASSSACWRSLVSGCCKSHI